MKYLITGGSGIKKQYSGISIMKPGGKEYKTAATKAKD